MVQTHAVEFHGSSVTKTFTSWNRREHRREWAALERVWAHAPGLAPEPLTAELDAVPPSVTMARIPGEPLGGRLTTAQEPALANAIRELWSVPDEGLEPWTDDLDFARALTNGPRPEGGIAATAFDAASAWWSGPGPALLATQPAETVLGHRDSNLANYLWDGERVRILDFEDSGVSDPAKELANLVEHLSARELDADRFCTRFTVDKARLRAARTMWAMFWLRLLLPGGPAAKRNPPGTAERQAERLLARLGHGGADA